MKKIVFTAESITAIILFFLLIGKIGVWIWAIDKGFDFTDEGWHMLAFKYAATDNYPLHEFHIVLSKLFFFTDIDIVTSRIIRLIAELACTFMLCFGVWKWYSSKAADSAPSSIDYYTFLGFVFMGVLLSTSQRSISFYGLSQLTIFSSAGLLFMLMSRPPKELVTRRTNQLVLVVIGLLLGFQFFIKFSIAIAMLLVVVLMITVFVRYSVGKVVKSVLWLLAGSMGSTILFFLIFRGPADWLVRFTTGLELYTQHMNYGIQTVITTRYIPDIVDQLTILSPAILVAAILLAFWYLFLQKRMHELSKYSSWVVSAILLLATATFYFTYYMYRDNFNVVFIQPGENPEIFFVDYYFLIIIFAAGLMLLKSRRLLEDGRLADNVAALLFLLLLPCVLLLGSKQFLAVGFMEYVPPFLIVIYLLVKELKTSAYRLPYYLIVISVVALSHYQFVKFFFETPYGTIENLTAQTSQNKSISSVKFDAPTLQFLEEVQTVFVESGFKNNDPIIALSDLPGLVYLMKGYSPGTPWYHFEFTQYNCYFLHRLSPKVIEHHPIVLINRNEQKATLLCLEEAGIGYPDSYDLKGSVFNPFSNQALDIFVHESLSY